MKSRQPAPPLTWVSPEPEHVSSVLVPHQVTALSPPWKSSLCFVAVYYYVSVSYSFSVFYLIWFYCSPHLQSIQYNRYNRSSRTQKPPCRKNIWIKKISNSTVFAVHTSYINQYRPTLTQYHQVLTSYAFYWPSAIMYQPVPLHTDQVPPSTK